MGLEFPSKYWAKTSLGFVRKSPDLLKAADNPQPKQEPLLVSNIFGAAVKIDISAEGREQLEYIQTEKERGNILLPGHNEPEPLKPQLMSNSYMMMIAGNYHKIAGDDSNGDISKQTGNFSSAVEMAIVEIIKGHTDGTRGYWTQADENTGVYWMTDDEGNHHYLRPLTMEDEINALLEEADSMVKFMAEGYKINAWLTAYMERVRALIDLQKARNNNEKDLQWYTERLKMANQRVAEANAIDSDKIYQDFMNGINNLRSKYLIIADKKVEQ